MAGRQRRLEGRIELGSRDSEPMLIGDAGSGLTPQPPIRTVGSGSAFGRQDRAKWDSNRVNLRRQPQFVLTQLPCVVYFEVLFAGLRWHDRANRLSGF